MEYEQEWARHHFTTGPQISPSSLLSLASGSSRCLEKMQTPGGRDWGLWITGLLTWGTQKPCPGLNLWDHGVAVTVLSPFWIENLLLQLSVLTWGLCIVASLLPRLGSGGWLLGTQAHHLSHIGLCGWPASCTDLPHCFGPACWAGPSEYHCLAVASV